MNKIKNNILCVSVMQSWGGGEEFLLNLCQNIKEYNFFIVSPKGNSFDEFKESNIQTIEINRLKKIYLNSNKWNLSSKLKMMLNIIFSTFPLIKIIKSKNIDLIFANGNFAGLYSLPAKILTKTKLVVVQHLIYKENSVEGKTISFLKTYSAKLVCVSNAVAQNVGGFLKDNLKSKILVIHNGVKVPDSIKSSYSDEIKIGMIGSIIRIKGIHLVLEALKDLLIQNDNVKFYICGEVTSEQDSISYKLGIKNFLKLNKIENKVLFCGHVKSKDDLYNNIDIVINFTTIPEAFPVSILEAMSYKKVVVAINEGGSKEIITDSFNGFLVEKENKSQLMERINFCIENFYSNKLNEIRNSARKTVMEKYSIDIFTKRYEKLFDQLIE